ncbi:family 16 glycosylhydrolase [Gramella sp. GC03-9]|uniref:Family 16 glycosylhydrolase n=1 Tax=Christiangramia oceanisediminis TaxID=2920386 RepID=A0A9X2I0K3_9FLAO|nr:family 16 glycosylhydrolase [Gramella oceanisediminis]MCP9199054.1 family 16 glycosylhydrolase [Gramella oceanisediminis]
MKNIFVRLLFVIALSLGFYSCEEDYDIGEISAPSNLSVETAIMGQSGDMPNGDGSGMVTFNASANNAMTYKFVFPNGSSVTSGSGEYTHQFSETGTRNYPVTVIAYGPGGTSSSMVTNVEVLVTYSPPQDLIDKLVGDGNREWRIKAEAPGHFGLGPVGGTNGPEWYAAGPNEKAGVGMYDDRYVFQEDGTFVHITNINTEDDSGTVFGRVGLVDQLGSSGGTVDGADVLNVPYSDYTANWAITAPGGNETINLTGLAFIGYYTGGDHRYQIFDRSVPNELLLKTTDGNNEFDWWFILTTGEGGDTGGGGDEFETEFDELLWEATFDDDESLDTSVWNYEIGNGDNGWGNQEAQYYTEQNTSIVDGNLLITARRESESGFDFTSSRITTQNNFEFTYGRVEARAKLPEGGGTWPAIWMLGNNFDEIGWPATGEIDIMEHKGNEPGVVHGTLHYPGASGGNADGNTTTIENPSSEFHIYTMEWSPERIVFLVDGEVYHTYVNTPDSPFNKDFFLIMNVAMGGTFGGDIDPAFQESSMEVDYIRVYQ